MKEKIFESAQEAKNFYEAGYLDIHAKIKIRMLKEDDSGELHRVKLLLAVQY